MKIQRPLWALALLWLVWGVLWPVGAIEMFGGSLLCGCFVSGSETENRAPQSLHMDLRVCTSTGANRSGICPAIFLGDLNSTHSFLMLEGLLLGLLRGRIIAFVKLADLTQELLSPAPSQFGTTINIWYVDVFRNY